MNQFETFLAAALRPIVYVALAWLAWLFVKAMAKHAPSATVRRWFQRIIDRATVRIATAAQQRQAKHQRR